MATENTSSEKYDIINAASEDVNLNNYHTVVDIAPENANAEKNDIVDGTNPEHTHVAQNDTSGDAAREEINAEKNENEITSDGASPNNASQPGADGNADPESQPQGLKLLEQARTRMKWFYIVHRIVNVVVLGLSAAVVGNADNSSNGLYGDAYLFTNFASAKLLLAISCWAILVMIFLYCSNKDYSWTEPLQGPWYLVNSGLAHGVTLILWFSGAVAHAAWLGQGVYCNYYGFYCARLTGSATTLNAFLDLFAWVQFITWAPPTAVAVHTSVKAYKARDSTSTA